MMTRTAQRMAAGLIALMLGGVLVAPAIAQEGPPVPFVVIASGGNSAIHEPAQVVARDRAAWLTLWSRHTRAPAVAAPAVDFTRDMVVAIFGGESRTPRAATIHRIVQESGRLVVWYSVRDTKPLLDGESLAVSAPFVMVRLARSALPVTFSMAKSPQVYAPPP